MLATDMAVSIDWGILFVGILRMTAVLFGVCNLAPGP